MVVRSCGISSRSRRNPLCLNDSCVVQPLVGTTELLLDQTSVTAYLVVYTAMGRLDSPGAVKGNAGNGGIDAKAERQ